MHHHLQFNLISWCESSPFSKTSKYCFVKRPEIRTVSNESFQNSQLPCLVWSCVGRHTFTHMLLVKHPNRCRKTYIYYCSQTFDSTNRMLKQQSIILIYSLSKMILFKFLRKWHVSYVCKIGFPCLRVWCQKLGQCFTSIFMIKQKILHKWTHQYFTKKWILTIHSWKSHCHT